MSTQIMTESLNVDELKRCFAHYPSGVVAITALVDGEKHVLVASSFAVGISLEPALVSLAIQKASSTWPILKNAATVGINVLAEGQGALCKQLAGKDKIARFEAVDHEITDAQAVRIVGTAAYMEGHVWETIDAGDHYLALIEVASVTTDHQTEPLVYHGTGFRRLEVA